MFFHIPVCLLHSTSQACVSPENYEIKLGIIKLLDFKSAELRHQK